MKQSYEKEEKSTEKEDKEEGKGIVTKQSVSEKEEHETVEEEEKKTSKTEKREEKTEEEISLTQKERLLLVFLNFIQQNKIRSEITGFQIKDFFEVIFPDVEVDEIYANLREQGFLSGRKDTKEFYVEREGRKKADNFQDQMEEIFEKVSVQVKKETEGNELLRRLLWLAYQDKYGFRDYFPEVREKLKTEEEIAAFFFNSDDFLKYPEIEKTLRRLRKEEKETLQEKLRKFSEDPDFLKALAIIRPEKLLKELEIEAENTVHRNFRKILSHYMEDSKVGDVLSKLALLGITESKNTFNLDIDTILEEKLEKIKEWLRFDGRELEKRARNNWNILLDLKSATNGYSVRKPEEFIKWGSFIPSKDGLLVRSELGNIWEKVKSEVEGKLTNKVKEIDNVVTAPFFNSEEVEDLEDKIIVTLHARDSWSNQYHYPAFVQGSLENASEKSRNLLAENIVLVISPKELGFKESESYAASGKASLLESPDQNKEYNALGETTGLDKVKDKFTECSWIKVEDDTVVKRAKEIIEEEKIPKISFDEALNEISELGEVYVETLYILSDKCTGKTAIGKNYYSEDQMWMDAWNNLKPRYPSLKKEDTEEIRGKLERIMKKKAETNLLRLSKEEIYERFEGELRDLILNRISNLDIESRRAIYTFLKYPPEHAGYLKGEYGNYLERFGLTYQMLFGKKFEEVLPDLLKKNRACDGGNMGNSKRKNSREGLQFFCRAG